MTTIDLVRTRDRYWIAFLPGAMGAGWTPWEALTEAITVWQRRGQPTPARLEPGTPYERIDTGSDWVIRAVFDHGPGRYYRYRVVGINLNCAPGSYGREIMWDVPDVDDRRFEFLPGAWSTWRCETCTRLGVGAAPERCPGCDSERHDRHGPRTSVSVQRAA